MGYNFITHRKTTLLLPDEVVAEIRREILRTPKYWAERIFSIVGYSLRLSLQLVAWGFILSLFVSLYLGRLDWDTVFHTWLLLLLPAMWVYLLIFAAFCFITARTLPETDIYEKYFSQAVEKRYGDVLDETVTFKELFAAKLRNARELLPDDETTLINWQDPTAEEIARSLLNVLIPQGSPPDYVAQLIPVIAKNWGQGGLDVVTKILQERSNIVADEQA